MNGRSRMRIGRRAGWAIVAAGLMAGLPGSVTAGQAEHLRIEIHEAFEDAFLSEACATPVVVSVDASVLVTLRFNQAGLVVSEISPSGGGTSTLSAPETGESIASPFNSTIIDYGSGATLGSSFTMTIVSLAGHVPGQIEADAGRLVLTGIVTGLDDLGYPLIELTDFVSLQGNSEDPDDVLAAICAALNP